MLIHACLTTQVSLSGQSLSHTHFFVTRFSVFGFVLAWARRDASVSHTVLCRTVSFPYPPHYMRLLPFPPLFSCDSQQHRRNRRLSLRNQCLPCGLASNSASARLVSHSALHMTFLHRLVLHPYLTNTSAQIFGDEPTTPLTDAFGYDMTINSSILLVTSNTADLVSANSVLYIHRYRGAPTHPPGQGLSNFQYPLYPDLATYSVSSPSAP